jgi:hypothetical protein
MSYKVTCTTRICLFELDKMQTHKNFCLRAKLIVICMPYIYQLTFKLLIFMMSVYLSVCLFFYRYFFSNQ